MRQGPPLLELERQSQFPIEAGQAVETNVNILDQVRQRAKTLLAARAAEDVGGSRRTDANAIQRNGYIADRQRRSCIRCLLPEVVVTLNCITSNGECNMLKLLGERFRSVVPKGRVEIASQGYIVRGANTIMILTFRRLRHSGSELLTGRLFRMVIVTFWF
jgi:hypothetical protein